MFENGQNMDPQTREGIRNLMQSVAQNFFNRTGMGIQPAPPPPPPKTITSLSAKFPFFKRLGPRPHGSAQSMGAIGQ